MSGPIERAARALARRHFSRDSDIAARLAEGEREIAEWLDWKVTDTWAGFVEDARAAIEAAAPETIVAAAIRVPVPERYRAQMWRGRRSYPDRLIVSAPPPARHSTLMHPMHPHFGSAPDADQGFLTSTGRYVGRKEALQIARAAGQPLIDHPGRHPSRLFSEDLW